MRVAIRVVVGFVALAVALPVVSPAQGPTPAPTIGQRVRVERQLGPRLTGDVVARSADTVTIREEVSREVTAVPVASIVRFERSAGRDRWRGARRGALVGGILGAVVVTAGVVSDLNCDECFIPASVFAVPAGVVLTLAGTGVGAMIGTERWEAVPVRGATTNAPRVRVGLAIGI